MTDLRALLGDERYDDVIERAARAHAEAGDDGCFDRLDEYAELLKVEPWHDDADYSDIEDAEWHRDHASAALAAVLPDLLATARREGQAEAWDEGHDAGFYARGAESDLTDTPNPYRSGDPR